MARPVRLDWRVAGGFCPRVPLYDTEGGWLHLSTDELVAGARRSAAAGWGGVKNTIGEPSAGEGFSRLAAVRAVTSSTSPRCAPSPPPK
ncbi:hypothetical protein [Amycolatopsis sp. NPDC051903]|uniref:hypothetical protein n=1 Tax=Amycolatopsis sp. NPDC051903 TaxID=3363936 RepID=UPI003798E312